MNAVRSPEESLRNQDAIKTNLMAVLTPLDRGNETAFRGRGLVGKTRMQCAHQQLGRDSPELFHGQEAITA